MSVPYRDDFGRLTPEYNAWRACKKRCAAKRGQHSRLYRERGIRVCVSWADSFEMFLADMGPRPSPNHSLDRIDNERGYEPGNCRWATRLEQVRNRRVSNWVMGRHVCEWAADAGVNYRVMWHRFRAQGLL